MSNSIDRRKFIGVGAVAAAGIMVGCSANGKTKREMKSVNFIDQAPDGKEIKAGLIGCGGRGTGAAINFLEAGSNLKIHALGDTFKDRIKSSKKKLNEKMGVVVAEENCFVGFDAFEKVIDSGVDVVILATPPHFRPEHFAAAVEARKNVFMEKPVAVDPVGARSIIASSKKAEALGLVVGTGTQRRHQRDYVATFEKIYEGAIGDVVSANCYWNMNQLWYRTHKKEWSEMEYMIRDWVNWTWLSGDHIVEQHVHNIDVANWYFGAHPIKALGFGSRQRRVTGDQYDNFSVDYVMEDGRQIHSMCRQINSCNGGVYEIFHGTKAIATTVGHKPQIIDAAGNELFIAEKSEVSPYVQEHINLITCIRQNIPFNEAEETANSVMTAIMG
ncbi:MAG: Gfo/Idh/MocA family oxidoreductase, partial [Melioribacteraceae bacterium]|nr:Gfo/Idh/MocA family oxidoreductase [Melioribacteraceae bacterium]